MDCVYTNRKHIARLAFFPFVFLLLLTLNFKIWGVSYYTGDPQETTVFQSHELEHCILTQKDQTENAKVIMLLHPLSDTAFPGAVFGCPLISFAIFPWIDRNPLYCNKIETLISLCVRMDS